MTHNIIHDEDKIKEILNRPMKLDFIPEYKRNLKEYAEHQIIKVINSQIDRLESPEMHKMIDNISNQIQCAGYWDCIEDQIGNLQSLKAQLTKSK